MKWRKLGAIQLTERLKNALLTAALNDSEAHYVGMDDIIALAVLVRGEPCPTCGKRVGRRTAKSGTETGKDS